MSNIFTKIRLYIHESNLIEGFDSDEADEALFRAWRYLLSRKDEQKRNGPPVISNESIKGIQSRAVAFQDNAGAIWAGAYRSRARADVTVGGDIALPWGKVDAAMDKWIEEFSQHTPKENHVAFEKIHPFIDGNGRTGRLLMWYQEFHVNGEQPTLIRNRDKQAYYDWFGE